MSLEDNSTEIPSASEAVQIGLSVLWKRLRSHVPPSVFDEIESELMNEIRDGSLSASLSAVSADEARPTLAGDPVNHQKANGAIAQYLRMLGYLVEFVRRPEDLSVESFEVSWDPRAHLAIDPDK